MGKMVYLLSTVIVVQLALLVVFGVNIPGSSLWDLFANPNASYASQNIVSIISDLALGIGASLIIIGTFVYKLDFVVFAGLAGVISSFGAGLVSAWQNICSQINPYVAANPALGQCTGNSPLIASIVVGPIIILYIFTVLEFWRGRD